MSQVGARERITQNRIIDLFQHELAYRYLGNFEEREKNSNIEPKYLKAFLKEKGYSDKLIEKAIYELKKEADNQVNSLYENNQKVYGLLRYGVKVREEVGENKQTVWLIDWENPLENDFYIAEEVTVEGEHKKRPDIVLYINGIAVGILELKRGKVSVEQGIRQNLDNQKSIFIQRFFSTIQLVMAGNDTQGLRYGTIETPEKYYLTWKEESEKEYDYLLDKHLIQLCNKERILEILHDFTLFDGGVKKLCRPHQYFGVKESQKFIQRKEGGIIWHTQGSGKSLTMVWLAKWIRENIDNSRVLIITDRTELDKQIVKVFNQTGEPMVRAKSGADLLDKLNRNEHPLLASLVHKFGRREEGDYNEYIQDIQKNLPKDFKAKGNIYVFVDECHRTQSGKLHDAMKVVLPDALFIGFTGTPLLKKDKKKSLEVFGRYIHTYKFDEAVEDKVVLDLRYEARDVDQRITNQQRIDHWFDSKTSGLNDLAKAELKKRWGTMKKVLSSRSRLEQIVNDIIFDFELKDRLNNGRGNALLVAGSVYQACKYYELFQSRSFKECAIVTSYNPQVKDIKMEDSGEGETENILKYKIYQEMLNGKSVEDFEEEVKDKFIKEPAKMKLLIVVDKLLTGFDAPPATYLFIDKNMQDHGLFQAICRVNRLDEEDKEYGYIVDYKDLFQSLEKSIKDYTSEAFDAYDQKDVEGLLKDRIEQARERLESALEAVISLCESVFPRDSMHFIRFFCGNVERKEDLKETEEKRLTLYKLTASLIRAYSNLANEMAQAGYTQAEAEKIKAQVKFYTDLREEIKHASGDYIDLKRFEPGMRQLIDMYIYADDSRKISSFDDISLINLIVKNGEEAIDDLPENIRKNKEAVAETIENNLRKVIIEEAPTNPKYFEKMSLLLDEIIKERRREAQSYEEYLKRITELAKQTVNPQTSSSYPSELKTPAQRALYDNTGEDADLALLLDKKINYVKQDNWRNNRLKARAIEREVKKLLPEGIEMEEIMQIIREQNEY
jgi:type I restriction enzyme R subunit